MDYQQKHPSYFPTRLKREKALDLYEGGPRVELKPEYLIRHPFETDKQYQIRLQRATYRNFGAPIVDVFSSFICDNRPERTLPAALQPMLTDVDRKNGGADVFFANIVRLAAAGGCRFTLIDMEPSQGITITDDKRTGRRNMPYFVSIDPDDVHDWALDDRGLAWVVVHSVENMPSEPFREPAVRDFLTVWTRTGWLKLAGEPHSRTLGGFVSQDMRQEASGLHPLGEVPLVPFLFEPVTPMTGNPATDDVLSLILRVYRRDSELDKMLFDCAVPLGIFNGLEVEQKEEFIRSSSNVLIGAPHTPVSGQYVEPQGNSYNALRSSLDNDIASIREIALRMVRPQSAVGASTESKNIDKQQLDTQLAGFARRCATAERKCWELAYKWLHAGAIPAREDIATPYNEAYDAQEVEQLDRQYLLEMQRAGAISNETYLRLLQKIGVLGEDFDVDAESAKLSQNLDNKSGEGEK